VVLSTWYQIPRRFSGRVTASIGSFNTKTYVNIGDEHKNYGYVLEYNNRNSDGFKTIDNSSKTGFRGNDYGKI
jgi:Fe(3+) dicitrate transport protein